MGLPLKSATPTCPMPPTMATQSQLLLLPQLSLLWQLLLLHLPLLLLLRPLLTQQTPSIMLKMTLASTTTDTDPNSVKQEVKTADGVTRGSYSYVDANGIVQTVNYISDAMGFRVAAT